MIFTEYATDTAAACREAGVATVAVTAGYVQGRAREDFFAGMDAANIDLKAFSDTFYRKLCFARLPEVLETITYVARHTPCWLELTTLLIPGANDSDHELHALCAWVAEHAGCDVPLHFTAFHPDFRLQDRPRTPLHTLLRARRIAQEAGLRYVYCGNVHHPPSDATTCPGCGTVVIQRDRYELLHWRLSDGACTACGTVLPGRFDDQPGTWGARRARARVGR